MKLETLNLGGVKIPALLLEKIPRGEWGVFTIAAEGKGKYTLYFGGKRLWRGHLGSGLGGTESKIQVRIYVGKNEIGVLP